MIKRIIDAVGDIALRFAVCYWGALIGIAAIAFINTGRQTFAALIGVEARFVDVGLVIICLLAAGISHKFRAEKEKP